MENDKNGNSPKESRLDQWIRQTLQSGGQPPNQKIEHGSINNQKKESHPKQGFFNRNKKFRPSGHKSGGKPQPGSKNMHHTGRNSYGLAAQKEPIRHFLPKFASHSYRGKLRLFPLGGFNEVGRNCMVLEYERDIIIIDMGLQFPDEDFLGVDFIIPDISYLEDKIDRIKGVVFTHGHLDHIGAVPYLLPKLNFPQMFGTQLTMELIKKRLKEFGTLQFSRVNSVEPNEKLKLGHFDIEFFSITHSIPDAVGLIIKTPAGNIVHTGDFKFDLTPAAVQRPVDFSKISALANQDIAALLIDSTNANKPGHTITEKLIGESLDNIVKNTEGRIIIASFASQIGRLQQIVNIAKKYGRNIVVSGRSLVDNFEMASKMGYLRVPNGILHEIHKVKRMPDNKAIILTTGSQGEDVSALSRMALEEHPIVKIKKGDTVILSSSPIPGNERAVNTVINNLCRLGAKVIDNDIMDVHASGHAQQEDLKLMMTLVKAKNVVPVHGEYYMRVANKDLAMSLGYSDEQTPIIENGDVLVVENGQVGKTDEKVQSNYILVDGLGVGDVGAQVIMDRQTMAENGVIIVLISEKNGKINNIDVISRGFIYMKESDEIVSKIRDIAQTAYSSIVQKRPDAKRGDIKKYIRESVDKYVHEKIERTPLVLPIITG